MSNSPRYPVSGQVEFFAEQAFIDIMKYDETLAAVFEVETGDANVVRSKNREDEDDETVTRTLPAIAVEFLCEQSIARTNEYHGRAQIISVTGIGKDKDGQMVQALAGAVRDLLHKDTDDSVEGHFVGDCGGFLEAVNNTSEYIVFHQIHELDTTPDDKARVRRLVTNVDAWLYPGRASE